MSPSRRKRLFLLLFLFALVWGPGLQVVGGFWRPDLLPPPSAGPATEGEASPVDGPGRAVGDERWPVRSQGDEVVGLRFRVTAATDWVFGPVTPVDRDSPRPLVLYFGFDCDDVAPRAAAQLRRLVGDLPPGTVVTVGGHADATGPTSYNDGLSGRRAREVRRALRGTGLRVRPPVRRFGELERAPRDRVVVGVPGLRGRALDRRVEVVPVGGGSESAPPLGLPAGPLGPCDR